MENNLKTAAWRQYEAGVEYKRRIGLYENVRRNERWYRGDQWYGTSAPDLPRPVFNVIRRVVDYLVCSVVSGSVGITYSADNAPFIGTAAAREAQKRGIELLNRNAAYRWDRCRLEQTMYRLALDAAISGDGVLYCYWDPSVKTGQLYSGDIVTGCIDNVNLFVADINKADIQSQDYVILAGRESVVSLRNEAKRYGVPEAEYRKITADREYASQSGDYADYELNDADSEKATCLVRFHRENGRVVFEKSTRNCVIRRCETEMTLYPVTYFNWYPTKNSCHGTSPITGLIPNQKYINRAYAMLMKHMTDTAFSKVIYDKSKIPEWTNEVGEAIAAVGGGNISDAVSVVGVGEMQPGYAELIENVISDTKELTGATETALGNSDPTNTSAILAMQEAARVPLMQIRTSFCRCIEELAAIWADMVFCYYADDRLLTYSENGKITAGAVDLTLLRGSLISARAEIGNAERLSSVTTQTVLDKLLSEKLISAETYVSMLPTGTVTDAEALIEAIRRDGKKRNTEEPLNE